MPARTKRAAKHLGASIAAARKIQGLPQGALGRQGTISDLERGENVRLYTLLEALNALGLQLTIETPETKPDEFPRAQTVRAPRAGGPGKGQMVAVVVSQDGKPVQKPRPVKTNVRFRQSASLQEIEALLSRVSTKVTRRKRSPILRKFEVKD